MTVLNTNKKGKLHAIIQQKERVLKNFTKQLDNNENTDQDAFEVCFTPEIEAVCKIYLEYINETNQEIYGDLLKLDVKAHDFVIQPFPLTPFPINKKSEFTGKSLLFMKLKQNNFRIFESDFQFCLK